jgi:uncharacterized membrane protein
VAPRRVQRTSGPKAELWMWPILGAAGALAASLLLTELQPEADALVSVLAWPGSVEAASSVLETISSAAITTLTLSFTLTVVALQLASQQFSPRLLRDFMRDRVTKGVFAVLVATFVFALITQRRLEPGEDIPSLAMLLAVLLSLASLGALLWFIHHITERLRVDTIMVTVHDEAQSAIDRFYAADEEDESRSPYPVDRSLASVVRAARSGFVRAVDVAALVSAAREVDVLVEVDVRPGDHVVQGSPLAAVWAAGGGGLTGDVPEELAEAVQGAVELGYERTVEQDAAFGFRQLTDIAVKSLSPAVNDPVTAAHALGHQADLLVDLLGKRLGPTLHTDDDGVGRTVVRDRDLRYYLDLTCGAPRRFGQEEPTALIAVLRVLRDVGAQCRDTAQRGEVERQVRLLMDQMASSMADAEQAKVHAMAERVRLALRGDVAAAYEDRSGETRSL